MRLALRLAASLAILAATPIVVACHLAGAEGTRDWLVAQAGAIADLVSGR